MVVDDIERAEDICYIAVVIFDLNGDLTGTGLREISILGIVDLVV